MPDRQAMLERPRTSNKADRSQLTEVLGSASKPALVIRLLHADPA